MILRLMETAGSRNPEQVLWLLVPLSTRRAHRIVISKMSKRTRRVLKVAFKWD